MATDSVDDQYFTYDGRLASFQKSKKRGSTAKGSKALNWPHKKISPESLSRAGFFFQPWPDNPDNVVCFLCQKNMDGWEDGDDPLREHLNHSPSCGWAITSAIEAEIEGYAQAHPAESSNVEARKATFAGRWPHDGKRGWKCKAKQLVDAGWRYTPTPESDDNATCTYCGLGLDGWEPSDKPYDEHHKRSPGCPFFALSQQQKPKKTARGKSVRASKASRLSTQSVATVASEAPTAADTTAAGDDTVLTTTSTMTQGGRKGRAKKSTTAKGRKTKAKKEEEEAVETRDVQAAEEHEKSPVAPPPKRATRGKKRGSDAVDESALTVASEAPARKKRATRARGSAAVDSSVVEPPQDEEMTDAPAPKKGTGRGKGRTSTTRTMRKASGKASSTRLASAASIQAPSEEFPDDDEIERQLEADLERPLTDDEEITADSDSERRKAKAKAAKGTEPTKTETKANQKSANWAMFDPTPAEPDDGDIEDELNALRTEMRVDKPEPEPEPETEQLQVPKKGRKAGTRKASKQTKSKKAHAAEPQPTPEEEPIPAEPPVEEVPVPAEPVADDEVLGDQDASLGSTDTVVKKTETGRFSSQQRGHARPSKLSLASQRPTEADELAEDPVELVEPPPKRSVQKVAEQTEEAELPPRRGRGRQSKASLATQNSVELVQAPAEPVETTEAPPKRGRGRPSKAAQASVSNEAGQPKPADPPVKRGRGRPPKKSSAESKSEEAEAQLQEEANAAELRAQEEASHPAEAEDPEIYEELEEPGLSPVQESPTAPSSASRRGTQPPSTPDHHGASPSASASQPVLSPSQSPQSSDAENQPPSSRPAASATTKRVALAPIMATPTRGSPSKRNVLVGLQSKTPWKPVDIDAVLGTPLAGADKENGVERLLRKGKELTSPEKKMTVEEWVYFNAGEAEKMLKQECEAMVSRFESEGAKAMNVLDGLVVDES